MKVDNTVQQDLFGTIITKKGSKKKVKEVPKITIEEDNEEFKKIDIENFVGEHKCPRCGFEWND